MEREKEERKEDREKKREREVPTLEHTSITLRTNRDGKYCVSVCEWTSADNINPFLTKPFAKCLFAAKSVIKRQRMLIKPKWGKLETVCERERERERKGNFRFYRAKTSPAQPHSAHSILVSHMCVCCVVSKCLRQFSSTESIVEYQLNECHLWA